MSIVCHRENNYVKYAIIYIEMMSYIMNSLLTQV